LRERATLGVPRQKASTLKGLQHPKPAQASACSDATPSGLLLRLAAPG
jgi:hypothetical protein